MNLQVENVENLTVASHEENKTVQPADIPNKAIIENVITTIQFHTCCITHFLIIKFK
jgi:hypothetical protein